MISNYAGATSVVPLIGRVLLATIFLVSGLSKLTNPAGTQAYIAAAGLPFPLLAYLVAVVVEFGAAILLVVGYRAREAGLVLALYCVVTAIGFHSALGDRNQLIHFLKNIAMAGGLLQVLAFGAGAFSVDNRIASSRAPGLAKR